MSATIEVLLRNACSSGEVAKSFQNTLAETARGSPELLNMFDSLDKKGYSRGSPSDKAVENKITPETDRG